MLNLQHKIALKMDAETIIAIAAKVEIDAITIDVAAAAPGMQQQTAEDAIIIQTEEAQPADKEDLTIITMEIEHHDQKQILRANLV